MRCVGLAVSTLRSWKRWKAPIPRFSTRPCAAGNWGLDAAWSQVAALVTSKRTQKPLLLAAIAAVASIRPQQAGGILLGLSDADDEEIAEAASEAMALAEGTWEEDEDGEEDASGWIN